MLSQAFEFAVNLHQHQTRKGSAIPYISHLMSVAAIVLEHGGSEDAAIAALLHDSLEDQAHHFEGGSEALRQAIANQFGHRILHLVEALTESDEHPKPPWRERKLQYLSHLQGASSDVMLVSMADKLHNIRSLYQDYLILGEALWSRFSGTREETLWFYEQLDTLYRQSGTHSQLADLYHRQRLQLVEAISQPLIFS